MSEPTFDLKVHHYDPKTGRMTHENHYIRHCGPWGEVYERPPGSGSYFDGAGAPIPRPPNLPGRPVPVAAQAAPAPVAEVPKTAVSAVDALASAGSDADALIEAAKREAEAVSQQARDRADQARAKNVAATSGKK